MYCCYCSWCCCWKLSCHFHSSVIFVAGEVADVTFVVTFIVRLCHFFYVTLFDTILVSFFDVGNNITMPVLCTEASAIQGTYWIFTWIFSPHHMIPTPTLTFTFTPLLIIFCSRRTSDRWRHWLWASEISTGCTPSMCGTMPISAIYRQSVAKRCVKILSSGRNDQQYFLCFFSFQVERSGVVDILGAHIRAIDHLPS